MSSATAATFLPEELATYTPLWLAAGGRWCSPRAGPDDERKRSRGAKVGGRDLGAGDGEHLGVGRGEALGQGGCDEAGLGGDAAAQALKATDGEAGELVGDEDARVAGLHAPPLSARSGPTTRC